MIKTITANKKDSSISPRNTTRNTVARQKTFSPSDQMSFGKHEKQSRKSSLKKNKTVNIKTQKGLNNESTA